MTVVISSGGRVVLPKQLRRMDNIAPGEAFHINAGAPANTAL